MKCHLLLGDWLSDRADMAPDISECTYGFWSFTVVEMCESGRPNPPSYYQFDVLHKIVFFKFLRLIPVLRYWVVCCGHRVGVLLVVGVGGGEATHVVCCADSQITGSPPLLSNLDILCEMEREGPLQELMWVLDQVIWVCSAWI